ncbi:MAG: HEAT repeat domain-containing protein [Spirochaetes bacterium]|nr:MAG: HEAT repeat domain-containing protein [Spirochaetota bacterium]
MKKRPLITAILLILLVLLPFNVTAQNNNNNEKTVEELFLQNIQMTVIGEQAVSNNRDSKLKALDYIEDLIASGKANSGDSDVHAILDYLSLTGTGVKFKEAGHVINNFPEVRRRSCELLGKLGGEGAKDTLVNILLTEDEPMVLSEAAYALGKIGINKNNQVSQALSYALLNQNILTPDNNFAFAVLLAYEKLAKANDGLNDPVVLKAIIRIQNGNYIKDVKRKAEELIKILSDY